MYKDHPSCNPPKKQTTKVWRYLDLTKLLSILENESLWFANITTLKTDRFEGFLNNATIKNLRQLANDKTKSEKEREKTKIILEQNLALMKQARALLNVSCWHINKYESAAMWQLYLKSDEGVAIQTTYKRLKESFKNEKNEIFIGKVKYLNNEKDIMKWNNVINYALHKRKSFEHEKELRAIVFSPATEGGGSVTVDLKTLIQKIYVAPNSPEWVFKLIKQVITRYGLDVPIEYSQMDERPIY